MSSASLLSLLYSGLQDDRLLPPKGIPKIETFQRVFRKSGRFTTEWFRLNFDGKAGFGKTAKATIPRRGHIVTRAFLVTVMPDIQGIYNAAVAAAPGGYVTQPIFGWTNSLGHALVQQAEVTIAGEPIDTLDGRLMEVLDEFHTPLEKVTAVNRMLGRVDNGFTAKTNGHATTNQEIITPLPFWFMRGDPSAALPIDAISLDAVQINITFSSLNSLYVSEPPLAFTLPNTSNTSNTGSNVGSNFTKTSIYCIDNTPFYVPLTNTTFTYVSGSNVVTSTYTTPANLDIVDSYILLEYVYLDKPEANRIRLANIEYPIVQHYPFIYETKGIANAKISLPIPNLTRDIYFMAHRPEADSFNAPFLATRDLNVSGRSGVWWPDAEGLVEKPVDTPSNVYTGNSANSYLRKNVLSIPGLQLWLDGVDPNGTGIAPANGERITSWIDKSGKGYNTSNINVGQATGKLNFYTSNGINGLGGIILSNYAAPAAPIPAGTFCNAMTIFAVYKSLPTMTNVATMFYRGGPTNNRPKPVGLEFQGWQYAVDNTDNAFGYGPAFNPISTTPILFSLAFTQRDSPSFYLYSNGTVIGSNTTLNPPPVGNDIGNLFILTGTRGSGAGFLADSIFGEVLVYNTNLSKGQRESVEGYLAYKWGLPLERSHPYYYVNPVVSIESKSNVYVEDTGNSYIRNLALTLPGLQLWLDGNDPNGNGVPPANGSSVQTWVDKSGNGYNSSNLNVGNAIGKSNSYVSSFHNGLGGMVLSNYAAAVSPIPTGTFANAMTVFIVFKALPTIERSGSIFYRCLETGSGFNNRPRPLCWEYSAFLYDYDNSRDNTGFLVTEINPALVTSPVLFSVVYTQTAPSSFYLYSNGILLASNTSINPAPVRNDIGNIFIVGGRGDGAPRLDATFGEVLVYNSNASRSHREIIEGYLSYKWGIPLQNSHPYSYINPLISPSIPLKGQRYTLIPAYSTIDSEPIASIALLYEGSLVRYATDMPALFRSILPGMEQIKSPWHNKYYYHIPFGTQHEQFGITNAMGHANLDKVRRVELDLTFKPYRGTVQASSVPTYTVYIWAETYNLLRVYGGRAGLLFGY